MVSRLVFKGDKKVKKSRESKGISKTKSSEVSKRSRGSGTGTGPGSESESGSGSGDIGWISATRSEELVGPLMITTLVEDNVVCVCSDIEGKSYVSDNVDIVDEDAESPLHKSEPSSVQQVFVATPIPGESSNMMALKSSEGRYLSVKEDGKIDAKSIAIGPSEIFEFILNDSSWQVKCRGLGTYLSITGEPPVAIGSSKPRSFVVRIQAQNKYKPVVYKKYDHVSTKYLEERVGRGLLSDEVKALKRANKEGYLNEALLDLRQKTKGDTRC